LKKYVLAVYFIKITAIKKNGYNNKFI